MTLPSVSVDMVVHDHYPRRGVGARERLLDCGNLSYPVQTQ